MPIVNGKYVSPVWKNGTAPAISAEELQALTGTVEKVPVANGGTGADTAAGARTNLGIGSVATENVLPVSKGGTGATSAAAARKNLGVPDITPVANGGTGAATAEQAKVNLGILNILTGSPAPSGGKYNDIYIQWS